MSVTIPATPHYFKVPGSHAMQAWRLDRADDVLLTLTGFAAVDNGRESYVSVTVEGPGLEVSRTSFTHPGDKFRAMKVDPKVQREVAEQVRGELLACLRDGTRVPAPGV